MQRSDNRIPESNLVDGKVIAGKDAAVLFE